MRNYLVLLYVVSVFDVFYLTPLSLYADICIQIFSLLGLFSFVLFRLYRRVVVRFIFIALMTLILTSVLSSNLFLNQDLLSSLIATQHIFKGFSVIYLYYLIEKKKINIDKILMLLIKVMWIYTLFIVFASLTDFSFVFKSPISGNELLITANKFQKDLLYFGQIYFLAKYLTSKKSINLFYISIIFISTQLYDIQRGDIIFLILTFLITIYLFRRYFSAIRIISLGFISTFIIGILAFSEISDDIFQKFNQATLVFSDEKIIQDPSIFVRLNEAVFALDGFSNHPFTGNGLIRGSKKAELIGDIYFYPADIGIVGVMYSFGIIGLYMLIKFFRKIYVIDRFKLNFVSLGLYLYLIYSFLYSIKDGQIIFQPARFLLCYLIIYTAIKLNNIKRLD